MMPLFRLMRVLLFWFAVMVGLIFLLANRQSTLMRLFPWSGAEDGITLPFFVFLLLFFTCGVVCGAALVWNSQRSWRQKARRCEQRLKEMDDLNAAPPPYAPAPTDARALLPY